MAKATKKSPQISFQKLFQDLAKKQYAPVYLIDGEESFYLDRITEYFEEHILEPAERDFNLSVMYGKDTNWREVVNACRRYPMFSERQVVVLKDAAQMSELSQLNGYVEHPSPTTLFLIEHRGKKVDGRSSLPKLVEKIGVYFSSEKVSDHELPTWIQQYGTEQGFNIGAAEADMLAGYLGNDLNKIVNELDKLKLNMPAGSIQITTQLIQKFIGISKEYNVMGFPEALSSGNKDLLYKMLQYFVQQPKSAPVPLLIAFLYNHFERMYLQHFTAGKSASEIMNMLQLKNEWMAKNYTARPRLSLRQVEDCLLLLGEWSGKFVGIDSKVSDKEWYKEFTARAEAILAGMPLQTTN